MPETRKLKASTNKQGVTPGNPVGTPKHKESPKPKSMQAIGIPPQEGNPAANYVSPPTNQPTENKAKPIPVMMELQDIDETSIEFNSATMLKSIIAEQKRMAVRVTDLTEMVKENTKAIAMKDKTINHLKHVIEELCSHADKSDILQADAENRYKEANLKLDGFPESPQENLIDSVVDLGAQINAKIEPADIETCYRIGKQPNPNGRPRTIMIKFKSREKRNVLYYNRTKLGALDKTQGRHTSKLWLNDDIHQDTARQRDLLRSIADLAKANGEPNVKTHSDGVVLNNKKIWVNDLASLPESLSTIQSKTVTRGDNVYFQSANSPLSNLYPTPLELYDEHFSSAEQCLQWRRAQNLGQPLLAEKIKRERNPYQQKRLGDLLVQSATWDKEKEATLEEIIRAKFAQNQVLSNFLQSTGTKHLNEATRDSYWGVGASLAAPQTKNHSWTGRNITGNLLEKIRSEL